MTRVGLMMIVKDEAHVVERCLASVRPFVSWWVVADTGSSDATRDVVRRALAGLPGLLVDRPWVDFGHNRQEVLDLARAADFRREDDYALWIDADQQLVDLPDEPLELTHDGYHLRTREEDARYAQLSLIDLARPWCWRGPVHEHLHLSDARVGSLSRPVVLSEHAGARSRDPDTYRKDAAVLERALAAEPDDPRLQFYLAQSLRDAGEPERALAAYVARATNPAGWSEERFYSWWQAGHLMERLDRPVGEVHLAFLRAHEESPVRAEPLVDLARLEREQGRFHAALLFARPATLLPPPSDDALFVSMSHHVWRGWDEVAISCWWTGRYEEGLHAARRAVELGPDDERLRANVEWCEQGVAEQGP